MARVGGLKAAGELRQNHHPSEGWAGTRRRQRLDVVGPLRRLDACLSSNVSKMFAAALGAFSRNRCNKWDLTHLLLGLYSQSGCGNRLAQLPHGFPWLHYAGHAAGINMMLSLSLSLSSLARRGLVHTAAVPMSQIRRKKMGGLVVSQTHFRA